MYSFLFVTWLLMFNPQFMNKAAGYAVESNEEIVDEEIVITTENTNVSDESTEHDNNSRYTVRIKSQISINSFKVDDINDSGPSCNDIIELNVGGQRITTCRSTLTAVRGSVLAKSFTIDDTTKTKSKSKDVAYFLDYNPVQFTYLLDQLREIKHIKDFSPYELNIVPPSADIRFNFSIMLSELGLDANLFLSPLNGVHVNITKSSLVGWKECYRGKYNTPFNASILTKTCSGKRLLVACRSLNDRNILTVAGVGQREQIFRPCSPNSYCTVQKQNDIGFYYVADNVWGFEGQQKGTTSPNYHGYQVYLSPCDTTDYNAAYRLCWSFPSGVGRGGGDRCGSTKNLHNSKLWERLIFQAV